ncbi:uncharacterized protein LY89DRAFT_99269 [Mollisia scopiformis]|uniref:Zn(2)-C6 fungal-type domain-containing protein n=1 Tax=Mollisia scopiformis TaxID=149040 RepID=A0A194X6X9_MOLSC|nr:uncharacterized protein LY89DRAFT_99269 [Mollisia scopiformis]KUJ15931.1 hypothetical protein LY89DRAFT_99269 [Mollisia scopiformis]
MVYHKGQTFRLAKQCLPEYIFIPHPEAEIDPDLLPSPELANCQNMGKAKDGPYRHACHECKSRHLKCDGLRPSCTKCLSAARRCDRAGSKQYIFRHDHNPSIATSKKKGKRKRKSQLQWSEDQDWAEVQPNLKFIDKSHDLDFLEGSESDNEDENYSPYIPDWPVTALEGSESLYTDVVTQHDPVMRAQEKFGTQLQRPPMSISELVANHDEERSPESTYNRLPFGPQTRSQESSSPLPWTHSPKSYLFIPPSLESSECLWPLQTQDEVTILQHFMSDLCPWFDYCDRDRHFQNLVIPACATDRTLFNAVLAVSARHLSRQGKVDPYLADRYQQKCLEKLIPEFNDQDTIPNDLLFAGTIVLRVLDEMTEDDPAIRFQGHGLSTQSLIRGREDSLHESSLRINCLRIELRQEVIISFMTRKPIATIAQFCDIDPSLEPADDWTWTYRIIACLADCLNLCYGEKRADAVEEYGRLSEYVAGWARQYPPTFRPIGSSKSKNGRTDTLPQIWFLNDCHVAAHHYFGLCRILLLTHDPTIPSIGVDRKVRTEFVDEQIREQVRLLCGIAISNRQHVCAMHTAGAAIAMCGERFTDPTEQQVLLDILIEAQAHVAWPSLRFEDILRGVWGL